MKKKFVVAMLALASMLTIAACGNDSNTELPTVSTDGTTTSSTGTPSSPSVTPENVETVSDLNLVSVITDRVVVDGKKQSYLTGEWKDEAVVDRRPFAIMVPNNKGALPQYGVSNASIIYEAPMEYGSCTRLMCVFEDYDELDHIGPVRSSRLYFVHEAMSLDAIYCNWGLAVAYVADTINSDRVDNISAAVSGINNASDEAFSRDAERKAAGYATEYTGIMSIDGYNRAVARQGYSTTYRDGFVQSFSFANDMVLTYDEYGDVNVMKPGGTSANLANGYGNCLPEFVYNSTDRKYYRYEYDEPQVDERTGEQLTATNVIFKFVYGAYLDDNGYLSFETRGWGDAAVFTSGKYIPATWTAGTEDNDPTYYWDADGNEIVLNQGTTWVCLIWSDYSYATSFFYDENR